MPRPGKLLTIELGPDRDRILERFYDYMAAEGPDSCWEWLGALNLGYGTMWIPVVKNTGAHRVAYALFKGPIPRWAAVVPARPVRGAVGPGVRAARGGLGPPDAVRRLRGVGGGRSSGGRVWCGWPRGAGSAWTT